MEAREFARHFRRNPDGSWTCTSHATLNCPKGRIQVTEGMRFERGVKFMAFDIASWLDEQASGARAPGSPAG